MTETNYSFDSAVGLLDMPNNIEMVCSQFLDMKLSRFDRNIGCNILSNIPNTVCNMRATSRRLRNIIYYCPFQFVLEFIDGVLQDKVFWDKLEYLQTNSS